MRKVISSALLFATIICFSSCSSDVSSDNSITKDVLVGTWVGVSTYIDGTWIDITTYPNSTYYGFEITFFSDGTYYEQGVFGTGMGRYTLYGNTIKTYVEDELYLIYKVRSWTETSAELTISSYDYDWSMEVKIVKRAY